MHLARDLLNKNYQDYLYMTRLFKYMETAEKLKSIFVKMFLHGLDSVV